uniref:Amino acid transporter transmembrane domain-containing protein n=1 Tax=Glossina pallidipes TaxID=7398 RepID=A0A1A9ZWM7_GLOPL
MDGQNYDAYNHRDDGSDKLSYSTALWHLMKFIWSTGMLIVPYAFQNIGWLMALGILVIMIGLTTVGLHVMFNSMYALCCRHRVPYLNIHAALQQSINEGPLRLRSFSKYSRAILDFILVIYYFGLSATYVMFIAEVIKQFVDYYYYEIDLWIYIYLMAGLLLIVQLLQAFKSMVLWIMIPIAFSHLGSYNK